MPTSRHSARVVLIACCVVVACRVDDSSASSRALGASASAVESPLVAQLATAAPSARIFLPRISIATRYHRCTETTNLTSSVCAAPDEEPEEAFDIGVKAESTLKRSPSADALHAVALVDLRWGGAKGNALNRSIQYLSAAARTSANPAGVLADLSAAELIRGEQEDDPRAFFAALDAAFRAVSLDSRHNAARFNLSLVAERLGLVSRAEVEWMHYLSLDSNSAWAAEARKHLATIRAQRTRRVPAAPLSLGAARALATGDAGISRAHGFIDELGLWGRAEERDDSMTAGRALAAAREIGLMLANAHRDLSLADAVADIDRARTEPAARRRLARAHTLYADGHARLAAASFVEAAALLVEEGNPGRVLIHRLQIFQSGKN